MDKAKKDEIKRTEQEHGGFSSGQCYRGGGWLIGFRFCDCLTVLMARLFNEIGE